MKSWLTGLKKTIRFMRRYFTRKIAAPLLFRFYALRPIRDDKILFVETHTDHLSSNYLQLFKRLETAYDLDIHFHFLDQGNWDVEKQGKMRFIRDAATARFLIYDNSNDLQAGIGKRRGQKILQTWHGAGAFKMFGYSAASKLFGDNLKNIRRFPSSADYDLVTVSSPEVVWAYVEAMGKEKRPEVVQPVGLSRTDVFYDPVYIAGALEHVRQQIPQARGRKILLYAPTFRGGVRTATGPDQLDIPAFAEAFSEEYVLLIKHHPYVKNRPAIPESCRDFAFDVSEQLSIEELICAADICISDYSSLVFEFSLFERPMIFYAYDIADYEDWRGFYYPYDELTPGPVFYENEAMIAYIRDIDRLFDPSVVHAFREKFMSACDGHATERIMERFFGDRLDAFRRAVPLPESELPVRIAEKTREALPQA